MSYYKESIRTEIARQGHIGVDPRHVEGYMRLGHSTLDGLSWKMRLTTVAALLFLLSCGTSEHDTCEAGPCFLVGDWTQEEARALTVVTNAITDAGYTEPGYAVNFIHDPNTSFKGTTWKQWRTQGIPARDPEVGYGGCCDREWCMVFVNRCGSKRDKLYELLVHELMHAVGFDHGPEMKAAEQKVWENLK